MYKVRIYSLNCPLSNDVKYVGKTKSDLSIRLSAHLSNPDSNIQKTMWIKSLKDKGLKPTINLLEVVNDSEWEAKEIWWIEYHLENGHELLNQKLDQNHKTVILKQYKEVLVRVGYRENTKKHYISLFTSFLKRFDGSIYKDITKEQIVSYLTSLVQNNNISESHQNSIINAVKFYYEKVLGNKREAYYIQRPFKRHKIRPTLSPPQVFQLIQSYSNLKQRTAIHLMYVGALRIGETCTLLTSDFNQFDGLYLIRDAKGGKDRLITLPKDTINMINIYLAEFKPKHYLFEGQFENEPYSATSIQIRFREQIKKLGFDHALTPHYLRHSRTSHLLNNGMKIESASKYIGHKSISTTADIYHHCMTDETKQQVEMADENIFKKYAKDTPRTIRQAS